MENIILDEIEDKDPNGKIPSTTRHYLSRYFLCLVWLFGLLKLLPYFWTYITSIALNDLVLILILRLVIPVYSIYYNLVCGYMEQKHKVYTPIFPQWMTGLTIGILVLNLLGVIYTTSNDLFYGTLTLTTSFYMLNIFCAAVVLLQEIRYYRWQN